MGDLEEAPGFWLWIGSALAVAVTWGVNHWMEDLLLSISSSLYISDLAIKMNKSFFLRFICFYWKARYTDRRKRDREEDLPFIDSLPKWLQWLELYLSEARSQEPLLGLLCRVPRFGPS